MKNKEENLEKAIDSLREIFRNVCKGDIIGARKAYNKAKDANFWGHQKIN